MNSQTKLWASVSGVSIAAAVVVGSALAATHTAPAPARPASNVGQVVAPAPSTVTVTASPTASRTAVVAVKVSPSKRAAVQKRQAVIRQEAPVNQPAADPVASTDAPQPEPAGATTYKPSIDPAAPGLPNPSRPGGQPHPSPSD